MTVQELITRQTNKALDDVIRASKAVPADKLDWAPEGARSTLSQMQEIARSAAWVRGLLTGQPTGSHGDASEPESLESCIQSARASSAELLEVVNSLTDERLADELHLPFGPGLTLSVAEVAGLHAWNLVYHLGQINYIQTCLGDYAMH